MSDPARASFAQRRIFVVEDEYMIADEIASTLSQAGAVVVGPAASVEDALDLLAAQDHLDGALLDVNLLGQPAWSVIDALLERDIPVVISTGYDSAAIPPAYVSLPRCEKPSTGREIARVLQQQLKPLA